MVMNAVASLPDEGDSDDPDAGSDKQIVSIQGAGLPAARMRASSLIPE
jgi:hypothetical protein